LKNNERIEKGTLDLAFDAALERLEFETNHFKHVESRFTTLLSGVAIVLSIFLGLTSATVFDITCLDLTGYLALGIATLLISASLIFFWGLVFMRNIKSAPQPEHILDYYLDLQPEELKYEIARYKVKAWKQVNNLLLKRVRLLKIGSGLFVLSAILTLIFMFVK
jgi:hypothetical protein